MLFSSNTCWMAGVDAGGRVEPDKVESALGAWGSLASALRKREQQKPARAAGLLGRPCSWHRLKRRAKPHSLTTEITSAKEGSPLTAPRKQRNAFLGRLATYRHPVPDRSGTL